MNVRGAALVPAGKERAELGDPGGVGELGAAKEGLAGRSLALIARIGAGGVAMPEVDPRPLQRRAILGLDDLEAKAERDARPPFRNVLPDQPRIEIERAFGLARSHRAGVAGDQPPGRPRRRPLRFLRAGGRDRQQRQGAGAEQQLAAVDRAVRFIGQACVSPFAHPAWAGRRLVAQICPRREKLSLIVAPGRHARV